MEECQFRAVKQWYFPRLCYQSLAHLQLRNFILYLTAVERFFPPPSVSLPFFCEPMYSYSIHNIPWPRDRRIIACARKCLLFVLSVLIIWFAVCPLFFQKGLQALIHCPCHFWLFIVLHNCFFLQKLFHAFNRCCSPFPAYQFFSLLFPQIWGPELCAVLVV